MLKSFHDNEITEKLNPFTEYISDEQFEHMLQEGFEAGRLDCYADLSYSDICYRKTTTSSYNWVVNIYITEKGIAVDHDYDCGGNVDNWTWWFDSYEESFEDAWNEMVKLVKSL
jgi:hypothetical protein